MLARSDAPCQRSRAAPPGSRGDADRWHVADRADPPARDGLRDRLHGSLDIATLHTVASIARGDADAGQLIDDLFMRITNAPIALLSSTPLKLRRRETAATSAPPHMDAPPEPLPVLGSSATAKASEALYWMLLQDFAGKRQGGEAQIVTPDEIFAGMIRGRHAKPETPESEPWNDIGEPAMAA
jgi:hypothetical protein